MSLNPVDRYTTTERTTFSTSNDWPGNANTRFREIFVRNTSGQALEHLGASRNIPRTYRSWLTLPARVPMTAENPSQKAHGPGWQGWRTLFGRESFLATGARRVQYSLPSRINLKFTLTTLPTLTASAAKRVLKFDTPGPSSDREHPADRDRPSRAERKQAHALPGSRHPRSGFRIQASITSRD